MLIERAGSLVYRDEAAGVARDMCVHYARPSGDVRNAPITIVLHGIDRAAAHVRDAMAARAERNGQLVLVPEFDLRQFPDNHAYNFGGVRTPPPESLLRARELWNFGILDRLFADVVRCIGSERSGYNLFGLSAGAQFVLRYLALYEAPMAERAVAANSGIYMLPDLTRAYPTGMGGIGVGEENLNRFLARAITILIGEHDIDPQAHDLPRGEVAEAQGPHRLARAQWYMSHCRDLARRRGIRLAWHYEVVPGAGHVSQSMYDRASDILAG